jgi:hypothetical protein
MRFLIGYLLQDFFRSYRYFVPSMFYLIIVVWIYSVVPNPIMSSYSTTSVILYMFSAWLAMNFLISEPKVQQQITVLHIRSKLRYAFGRILAVWLITTVLALFAVIYPTLSGAFDQSVTGLQMLIALYAHLLLALVGIISAFIFHSLFRLKFIYSLGGLLLCLVISLAAGGIGEWLPEQFSFLAWLLPPAAKIMFAMTNFEELSVSKSVLYLGYPLIYLLPYGYLCLRIMNRKQA